MKTSAPPPVAPPPPVDAFERIKDLCVQTKKVTAITNEDEEKLVVEYISQIEAAWKQIEDMRTASVKPLNDRVKSINAEHKAAQQPADIEKTRLRAIWQARQRQKQAAAQAEAARAQKAQEEAALAQAKALEDRGDKAGAEHVLQEAASAPVVQPVVETKTRTAVGTMYERDNWVVEIDRPEEVPDQYWSVDQAKLDQAVKMGLRDGKDRPGIAGCRIVNKPIAARR